MKFSVIRLAAAAAVAFYALPSSAVGPGCVGTDNTQKVCVAVNPEAAQRIYLNTTKPLYRDCVYTGGTTCTAIAVPNVSIAPGRGSIAGELTQGTECEGAIDGCDIK